MAFSDEQRAKVLEVVNRTWQKPCPVCDSRKFSLIDDMAHIDIGRPATSILPSIAITCATCGYVMLFSVIGLGLADILNVKQIGDA